MTPTLLILDRVDLLEPRQRILPSPGKPIPARPATEQTEEERFVLRPEVLSLQHWLDLNG